MCVLCGLDVNVCSRQPDKQASRQVDKQACPHPHTRTKKCSLLHSSNSFIFITHSSPLSSSSILSVLYFPPLLPRTIVIPFSLLFYSTFLFAPSTPLHPFYTLSYIPYLSLSILFFFLASFSLLLFVRSSSSSNPTPRSRPLSTDINYQPTIKQSSSLFPSLLVHSLSSLLILILQSSFNHPYNR